MHNGHGGIPILEQQSCGQAHNVGAPDHDRVFPSDGHVVALEQLDATLCEWKGIHFWGGFAWDSEVI